MSMRPRLSVRIERWPIAGSFAISRGSKNVAEVVVAEIADGVLLGRGECVPYQRYGETVASVAAAIENCAPQIATGLDRAELQGILPAGAARNALDCALWDLAAKRAGRRVWELAGIEAPRPVLTAYTISLDTPDRMAAAARRANRPLLKLKLGAPGDPERLHAVRAAVPGAELIADANEGWRPDNLSENLSACAASGVRLVEQPLAADADGALASIKRPLPVCADESLHTRADVPKLAGKYEAVNIKLDKAGGLTEALALAEAAARAGFRTMVGSMVSTSLAVAPALLLTPRATFVDLDGPLLLERDRPGGLVYEGSRIQPFEAALWG
jgi:L-alanine-DL-glutamate epimerase-like enolase superfamily enzyme